MAGGTPIYRPNNKQGPAGQQCGVPPQGGRTLGPRNPGKNTCYVTGIKRGSFSPNATGKGASGAVAEGGGRVWKKGGRFITSGKS